MVIHTQNRFKLNTSPREVQFTVHLNNLLNTYNRSKKYVLNCFKDGLLNSGYNPDKYHRYYRIRVEQLINEYGKEFLINWFKEIYGWEIKQAV